MEAKARGSIIFKLIIVLLIFLLVAVILIPAKIWKEETTLQEISQRNMTALYEAEQYYYREFQHYLGADSLQALVGFVQKDSSLNSRRRIGKSTNLLFTDINDALNLPSLKAILPISQSLEEINEDLKFNNRLFKKYPNIHPQKEYIVTALDSIKNHHRFTHFSIVRNYVDSLYILKERINDLSLQASAQYAVHYTKTLSSHLGALEIANVDVFWKREYKALNDFIKSIKTSDIIMISSVADRLERFIERINASMTMLQQLDIPQNVQQLRKKTGQIEQLKAAFSKDSLISRHRGILQLNEVDSILIKLDGSNFTSPDHYYGKNHYLIDFKEGQKDIVIESPNLLPQLQQALLRATQPLKNLAFYAPIAMLNQDLTKTLKVLAETRETLDLRRLSNIFIEIKEIELEIKNLSNRNLFYRYVQKLKTFTDTLQTEQRLSVLRPMIENLLNPMDSLASRIQHQDIGDLEETFRDIAEKLRQTDQHLLEAPLSASQKSGLTPFDSTFQNVFQSLNRLKSALNPEDSQKIQFAAEEIENVLLDVLDGYEEVVYFVFFKKHANHGFIRNGNKSWEKE